MTATDDALPLEPPPLPPRPARSRVLFALRWAVFTFTSSIILSQLLTIVGLSSNSEGPFDDTPMEGLAIKIIMAFGFVVFSPVFETLGLVLLIGLTRWLLKARFWAIVIPSAIWCVLHSVSWPPWGIIVSPLFLVCAWAYLEWRPVSRFQGYLVATLIHVFHNIVPAIAILSMDMS